MDLHKILEDNIATLSLKEQFRNLGGEKGVGATFEEFVSIMKMSSNAPSFDHIERLYGK